MFSYGLYSFLNIFFMYRFIILNVQNVTIKSASCREKHSQKEVWRIIAISVSLGSTNLFPIWTAFLYKSAVTLF